MHADVELSGSHALRRGCPPGCETLQLPCRCPGTVRASPTTAAPSTTPSVPPTHPPVLTPRLASLPVPMPAKRLCTSVTSAWRGGSWRKTAKSTSPVRGSGLCAAHLGQWPQLTRACARVDGCAVAVVVRAARSNARFRGTALYASLAAHEGKDQGRVDDLWALFYVLVDLCLGGAPWRNATSRAATDAEKVRLGNRPVCVAVCGCGCGCVCASVRCGNTAWGWRFRRRSVRGSSRPKPCVAVPVPVCLCLCVVCVVVDETPGCPAAGVHPAPRPAACTVATGRCGSPSAVCSPSELAAV